MLNINQQKTVKITNKRQFEHLVDFMSDNPDIARGYAKSGNDFKIHLKNRWQRVTEELNSLGPPSRNVDGWIKVWTDFKFKIRKKMTHNKTEIKATGGGPNKIYSFNNLEEKAIDLLQIEMAFNPPGHEFGGSKSSRPPPQSGDSVCAISQSRAFGSTLNVETVPIEVIEEPSTNSTITSNLEDDNLDFQATEVELGNTQRNPINHSRAENPAKQTEKKNVFSSLSNKQMYRMHFSRV